jgi:hypothetical protein
MFSHLGYWLAMRLIDFYLVFWYWIAYAAAAVAVPGVEAIRRRSTLGMVFCVVPIALGVIVHVIPWLVRAISPGALYGMPIMPHWILVGELCLGLFTGWFLIREGVSLFDRWRVGATKTTVLERGHKTDVRHMDALFPSAPISFDPTRYFDLKRGIFIALDKDGRPIYVPCKKFDESHMLLCGRTRSGKGIALQTLGSQSILRDELFVVLDPKFDRWLSHVLYQECQRHGRD